jgi:hypothetical protein
MILHQPPAIIPAMDHQPFHWSLYFVWLFNLIKALKIFGIIPGAIAARWVQKIYQTRRQARAQEGWPSTEATIQSAKVHVEGRRHWAEITYTYFVDEYRVGTYLRNFKREEEADDFVRQLKDRRLQVHYKPNSPETSVILDRDLEMIVLLVPQYR